MVVKWMSHTLMTGLAQW